MLPKISIYTDGSCRNNGSDNAVGAWGFIVVDEYNEIIQKAHGCVLEGATNQRMELIAVLQACYWAYEHCPDRQIQIFSDSAYLCNAYQQNWVIRWEHNNWMTAMKTPVKNRDLWERLSKFFKDFRYDFCKVKGHATDYYNNMVDQLVQSATLWIKNGDN